MTCVTLANLWKILLCNCAISHNISFRNEIYFLFLNGVFCGMGQVHCVICDSVSVRSACCYMFMYLWSGFSTGFQSTAVVTLRCMAPPFERQSRSQGRVWRGCLPPTGGVRGGLPRGNWGKKTCFPGIWRNISGHQSESDFSRKGFFLLNDLWFLL